MCINQAHINKAKHLWITDFSGFFHHLTVWDGLKCKSMHKLQASAHEGADTWKNLKVAILVTKYAFNAKLKLLLLSHTTPESWIQ